MAPAARKEREPEYSRIRTGATELDSPPKRMASNPMYTSREHGELGHGLRGTNLPAEKLQPLIPDRAIVKRLPQNSTSSTRSRLLPGMQTWRRDLEIAHPAGSRFRAAHQSTRVHSTWLRVRQNHSD